jgi:hypothetical protein
VAFYIHTVKSMARNQGARGISRVCKLGKRNGLEAWGTELSPLSIGAKPRWVLCPRNYWFLAKINERFSFGVKKSAPTLLNSLTTDLHILEKTLDKNGDGGTPPVLL